ncbi:hypothetical protein N4R57_13465 [Rhodobacteraceae bacterium D3-12]|nr:hypothetical protein N4R57_13465 [Rhodobacteraceae bacterium D3-12]
MKAAAKFGFLKMEFHPKTHMELTGGSQQPNSKPLCALCALQGLLPVARPKTELSNTNP